MFWVLLTVAVFLGLLITWVDSQPTWDDTGITAGMIFIVTALLGSIMPNRALIWAIAVGGGIPLMGITQSHNYAALLALFVALFGAYAGALGRKITGAAVRAGTGKNPQP
jgi:hypothetical protein